MKLLVKMLPLRLPTICIAHTLAGCDYLLCMLSVMRTALHIYFACAASCALLSVMRTALHRSLLCICILLFGTRGVEHLIGTYLLDTWFNLPPMTVSCCDSEVLRYLLSTTTEHASVLRCTMGWPSRAIGKCIFIEWYWKPRTKCQIQSPKHYRLESVWRKGMLHRCSSGHRSCHLLIYLWPTNLLFSFDNACLRALLMWHNSHSARI